MKGFFLGVAVDMMLAGGLVYVEGGWFLDSTGRMGTYHDHGNRFGWYQYCTGTMES